jgi:hypothetical protein
MSQRKKAVPKIIQGPPIQSLVKEILPKAVPEQIAPEKETLQIVERWETKPDNTLDSFGCCHAHSECIAAGDCVKKHFHTNYATACSLYKTIKRGVRIDGQKDA